MTCWYRNEPVEAMSTTTDKDFNLLCWTTPIRRLSNPKRGYETMISHLSMRWSAMLLVSLTLFLMGGIDRKTQNALKVQHILKTIERQLGHSSDEHFDAEVTEAELNDYIAHRLAKENRSTLYTLSVTLRDNNQIGGKLRFDAKQLNLDVLLGDHLDFDFKGTVFSRNGTARLDLTALHMNGQAVNPQVLDFVLHTAALAYGEEPGGIGDWYALPKGIKALSTTNAKVVLHY